MITIEDLQKKASEIYPDSKEMQESYIRGCKDIAKLVFDRERDKKESVRSKNEPFYDGFKNAIDGIITFLNPVVWD